MGYKKRESSSPRRKIYRQLKALERAEKERKLQEALQGFRAGKYRSLTHASEALDVPYTTLLGRSKGVPCKQISHQHLQKMTKDAEAALERRIKHCAYGGFPLTPRTIIRTAERILHTMEGEKTRVGTTWLQSFMLRHPDIDSKYSRCLDKSRMSGVDESGVRAFYARFKEILDVHNVRSDMIFNMDETGFNMGSGISQRVVIPKGKKRTRFKMHAGNRDSVTIIECIGSGGQDIPPLVIFKGKLHMYGDHDRMDLGTQKKWFFAVTPNAWTSNDIACDWLVRIFDPATKPHNENDWRLLLMDGHISHVSLEFLDLCWKNNILPLCLPPHSTHIMQPLDVCIFGPLSMSYRKRVTDLGGDVDHIDKAQFATFYAQARAEIITPRASRAAFSSCGYTHTPDPEKVLKHMPGMSEAIDRRTPPPNEESQPIIHTPTSIREYRLLLDSLNMSDCPRRIAYTKRTLMKAFTVHAAERGILMAAEDQRKRSEAAICRSSRPGDRRILSKDIMISSQEAATYSAEARNKADAKKRAAEERTANRMRQTQQIEANTAQDESDDESVHDEPFSTLNLPSTAVQHTNLQIPGPSLLPMMDFDVASQPERAYIRQNQAHTNISHQVTHSLNTPHQHTLYPHTPHPSFSSYQPASIALPKFWAP